MPQTLARCVLAAALIAVPACNPSTLTGSGVSGNGQVSWKVLEQRVEVTNASSDTIHYAVVGRAYLHNALVDWCFGFPQCGLALPPKLTALIQYVDISGSAPPETEAMIVWWVPRGTGAVPFDTAIVKIR